MRNLIENDHIVRDVRERLQVEEEKADEPVYG